MEFPTYYAESVCKIYRRLFLKTNPQSALYLRETALLGWRSMANPSKKEIIGYSPFLFSLPDML